MSDHCDCPAHKVGQRLVSGSITSSIVCVGIANIILAIALLAGGVISHSLPILMESGHQALDALLLVGIWATLFCLQKRDVPVWDIILTSKLNLLLVAIEGFGLFQAFTGLRSVDHADPHLVFLIEGTNIIANLLFAMVLFRGRTSTGKFFSQHNLYDCAKSSGVLIAYFAIRLGYPNIVGLSVEALTAVAIAFFIILSSVKQMIKSDRALVSLVGANHSHDHNCDEHEQTF